MQTYARIRRCTLESGQRGLHMAGVRVHQKAASVGQAGLLQPTQGQQEAKACLIIWQAGIIFDSVCVTFMSDRAILHLVVAFRAVHVADLAALPHLALVAHVLAAQPLR